MLGPLTLRPPRHSAADGLMVRGAGQAQGSQGARHRGRWQLLHVDTRLTVARSGAFVGVKSRCTSANLAQRTWHRCGYVQSTMRSSRWRRNGVKSSGKSVKARRGSICGAAPEFRRARLVAGAGADASATPPAPRRQTGLQQPESFPQPVSTVLCGHLGSSVRTVARWIGRRLIAVDEEQVDEVGSGGVHLWQRPCGARKRSKPSLAQECWRRHPGRTHTRARPSTPVARWRGRASRPARTDGTTGPAPPGRIWHCCWCYGCRRPHLRGVKVPATGWHGTQRWSVR